MSSRPRVRQTAELAKVTLITARRPAQLRESCSALDGKTAQIRRYAKANLSSGVTTMLDAYYGAIAAIAVAVTIEYYQKRSSR